MTPIVETVSGHNPWRKPDLTHPGVHGCYFCRPDNYLPMPEFHTLCCCCSQLIFTPEVADDPMNEAMLACERCEKEFAADSH